MTRLSTGTDAPPHFPTRVVHAGIVADPPVALVLGVLVRGEHVAGLSVVGGVVCLAGAWLMWRAQMESSVRAPAAIQSPQPASASSSS